MVIIGVYIEVDENDPGCEWRLCPKCARNERLSGRSLIFQYRDKDANCCEDCGDGPDDE